MLLIGLLSILSLCLTFALAGVGAGCVFNWLWGLCGTTPALMAFPFVFALLALYVGHVVLLAGVVRLVRSVTPTCPERVPLATGSFTDRLQSLRVMLDAMLTRYAGPLVFVVPPFIVLLGARVGKNFVLAGRLYNPDLFEAGDNVMIGGYAVVTGHLSDRGDLVFGRVVLGDNCVIGGMSFIMPGVTIGEGATVAAGAVVPKGAVIPPGEIWGGVPAKRIRAAQPSREAPAGDQPEES